MNFNDLRGPLDKMKTLHRDNVSIHRNVNQNRFINDCARKNLF